MMEIFPPYPKELPLQKFDAVVLGVAHNEFLKLDLEKLRNDNSVLYDVKGVLKGGCGWEVVNNIK